MGFIRFLFFLSIFTSTVLSASAAGVATSGSHLCKNIGEERRAQRLIRAKRTPFCTPKKMQASSSSSLKSASSTSLVSSSPKALPVYDTLDGTIASQILLLKSGLGPIIGAASIFVGEEPMDLRSVSLRLASLPRSLASLAIFTDDREFLGYASYDPSDTDGAVFTLTVPPGTREISRNIVTRIYVRPQLLTREQGGIGAESIQIMSIVVRGNGIWSSASYSKQSNGTYLPFVTARGRIVDIQQLNDERGTLTFGDTQEIARFRFIAEKGDPGSVVTLHSLTFSIGRSGDVRIEHPLLRVLGSSQTYSCTFLSTSLLRCDGFSIALSSLEEGQTVLELDADLHGSDNLRQSVQLSLSDRGTPDRDGGILWSDGTSNYGWVPLRDAASTSIILSR